MDKMWYLVVLIIPICLIPSVIAYTENDTICNYFSLTHDCFNELYEQNQQIIKKLDWSNCVAFHKNTLGYHPPQLKVFEFVGTSSAKLIEHCGEPPFTFTYNVDRMVVEKKAGRK